MSGDIKRSTSPRPDPSDLRASDAERDDVAAALGDHFQAGRLTQAEFDDRVTAALTARTRRDLSTLMADLPARPAPAAAPATAASWRPVWLPVLVAAFITAGLATHGWGAGTSGHHAVGPWPVLMLWWVIPVVAFRIRRPWAGRAGRPGAWQ
jgi:hypothetical protein